jgi:hypothetical protein
MSIAGESWFGYRENSRENLVGIPTAYGLDDRWVGVLVPVVQKILSSRQSPGLLFGIHPTSYPLPTGALSTGIKRPRREADNSSSTSAEIKKTRVLVA